MEIKDYYNILGVSRTSSQIEIRKKYLGLVRLFHPDKNNNIEAYNRFQEITEAYSVLGDLEKRLEYHQHIHISDDIKFEARERLEKLKRKRKIRIDLETKLDEILKQYE